MLEFKKLTNVDGSWQAFQDDWKQQCEKFDEDFDDYYRIPLSIVRDLAEDNKKDAAIYALFDGKNYLAMCQLNVAGIPGYEGKVLRARMIYLSPTYDLGYYSTDDYSKVLSSIFSEVFSISGTTMSSKHIKFHLPSVSDRQFYDKLTSCIRNESVFKDIQMKGSWLYITKN